MADCLIVSMAIYLLRPYLRCLPIPHYCTMPPLPSSKTQPKTITVLGSTGSIGKNAMRLLEMHGNRFHVEALTAYGNVELLAQQATRLKAKRAVIGDEARYLELKSALSGTGIEAEAGSEAVIEA